MCTVLRISRYFSIVIDALRLLTLFLGNFKPSSLIHDIKSQPSSVIMLHGFCDIQRRRGFCIASAFRE